MAKRTVIALDITPPSLLGRIMALVAVAEADGHPKARASILRRLLIAGLDAEAGRAESINIAASDARFNAIAEVVAEIRADANARMEALAPDERQGFARAYSALHSAASRIERDHLRMPSPMAMGRDVDFQVVPRGKG